MRRAVQKTAELRRVVALPRRDWEQDLDSLIDPLSQHLTLPHHVCNPKGCAVLQGVAVTRLRPIQAAALADAHDHQGLFLQGIVGLGKTLITMLLPVILASDRTLLIVPAGLKIPTRDTFRTLRQHWSALPMRIESYELFGRDQSKEILRTYFAGATNPLLVLDEAQHVKDRRAGCTRKIDRFVKECREAGIPLRVCAMSGTTAKRSLKDFWHILKWCRPDLCPLPLEESDLIDWALAVDELGENLEDRSRLDPGALMSLCNELELAMSDRLAAARSAVGRRIFETPGVIASKHPGLTTPLHVNCLQVMLSKEEDDAFECLRTKWVTPDQHPIADAVALWRHARELALNFFYRWEPAAPLDWLYARSDWCAAVREILSNNRRELDTEFQVSLEVAQAIHGRKCPRCKKRLLALHCQGVEHEDGTHEHEATETKADPRPHAAAEVFEAWHRIKDTFVPNTVPVWVGDTALRFAADWARSNVGIVWTEHKAFALKLAELSGLRYFGRGGCDAQGRPIEKADPGQSCIASIASNKEGRNLQAWHKSLVTSFPPTGTVVEQMIGRMHRPGQRAEAVTYDVLIACREQLAGFEQARRDCTFHQDLRTNPAPKLSIAAIDVPIIRPTGWAWKEQQKAPKVLDDVRLTG